MMLYLLYRCYVSSSSLPFIFSFGSVLLSLDIPLFIHSLVYVHFGYFQILTVENKLVQTFVYSS